MQSCLKKLSTENGGKQPSSPGLSSLIQCRTTETIQKIIATKSTFKEKKAPEKTKHAQCTSMHKHKHTNITQMQRYNRGLSSRAAVCWKLLVTSASISPSQPHQWQGSPAHGLLIRDCSFLQHSTMGSSPDCCSESLSTSQPLFWQGICWPFFYPYHGQTSFPLDTGLPPLWNNHIQEVSHMSALHVVTLS